MKRITFLTILLILLVSGISAQVKEWAVVTWIQPENPGAEPSLCVFGHSIDDVMLLDGSLNLGGHEVMWMRQRQVFSIYQNIAHEMERLNMKYAVIYTFYRRIVDGPQRIETFFLATIIEKDGNNYYHIGGTGYIME